VNFVWLGGQVKPKASGRNLALAGGLVLVVGLAGGGLYAGHAKAEGEFKRHLAAATQASQTGDAVAAAQEIELALQRHPDNEAARAKRKDIQDQLQKEISANFAAGQLAEKSQQWNDAKGGLDKARQLAGKADNPQPSLAALQTERDYVERMDAGVKALADKHWDAAAEAAQKALGLKPADAAAQGLLTQAQEMKSAADREQSAAAAQKLEQDFQAALADAQKAFKDGNASVALQQANVALGLKPDQAEARQLAAMKDHAIIVNTWRRQADQWGKTLVFATSIEHADNLTAAWHYFGSMFGLMPVSDTAPLLGAAIYTPYRSLILVLCAGLVFQPLQAHDWAQRPVTWPRIALATPLFVVALMTMYSQAFTPFLYFQF